MFSPRLKQDGQDGQDLQDGGRLGLRPKGLEDLNVYRDSRNYVAKVLTDLNVCSGGWGACEGQALALRAAPQAPVGLDRLIRTPSPCSSRVPALDLFVIRRSQPTERRRGDSD